MYTQKSFFQETHTLFPRTNKTPSEMKNSLTYSKERFKDDYWKLFSNKKDLISQEFKVASSVQYKEKKSE